MKLYVQTYGCQMNQLDSARIVQLMKSADYEPTDSVDDADLIILNTCSVRDKAEQKVYSALGQAAADGRGGPGGRPTLGGDDL